MTTIVGKPRPNPYPSWYDGLEDLPPCCSADTPNGTQRAPVWDFIRITNGDNNHAGLGGSGAPQRIVDLLAGSVAQISVPTYNPLMGGLLYKNQLRPDSKGFIVICETSLDGHWTWKTRIHPTVLAAVRDSFHDPESPVININAVGAEIAKVPIDVIDEAMTINGTSNSTAPYQAHLVNILGAMRPGVREELRARGDLCAVTLLVMEKALKSIGLFRFGKLWPSLVISQDTHMLLARNAAVISNAMKPDSEEKLAFEDWFPRQSNDLQRKLLAYFITLPDVKSFCVANGYSA